MDPALFHDASAVGDALCRVVVSADDKNLEISLCQRDQEVIKQVDSLYGGDGFVIDIPGDDHCVRGLPVSELSDLLQYIFLIFDHGKAIDSFAQMKI